MAALRVGVAPLRIENRVEVDRQFVLALEAEGDRQFHPRRLLAELSELAVAELALVDEITQRAVGELGPIRASREARRSGTDKRDEAFP
jgi:hypothetical protein